MSQRRSNTVVTTVGRAVGEHQRELFWLACIGVGLLATVALWGLGMGGAGPDVPNPGGRLGRWVAEGLYGVFGVGSWFLTGLLIGVAIWRLADRPLGGWWRWVAGLVAGLLMLGALATWVGEDDPGLFHPAGRVGVGLSWWLHSWFGSVGFWAVSGVAWLGSLGVLFRVSWSEVSESMVGRVEAELPRARKAASSASETFGAWALAGARSLGTVLLALLVRLGQGVLRTSSWVVTKLRDLIGAVWDTLWKRTDGFDDPAWVSQMHSGARSDSVQSSGGVGEGPADPTVIRASVAEDPASTSPEVEVGWEQTRLSSVDVSGEPDAVLRLYPEVTPRDWDPESSGGGTTTAVVGGPDTGNGSSEPAVSPPVRRSVRAESGEAAAEPPSVGRPNPRAPVDSGSPGMQAPGVSGLPLAGGVGDAKGKREDRAEEPDASAASPHRPKVEAAEGLRESPEHDDGRAVSDAPSLYFKLPPLSLLDPVPEQRAEYDEDELSELAEAVEGSLASFKVTGKVTEVRVGPVVTTFEFLPDPGISVRKVSNLTDDLAMAMAARSVRVLAPIPGKGVVGIEVPNDARLTIYLREMLGSKTFRKAKGALPVVLGKDVEGRAVIADLAKMPHLLIGGTTGSGKSVGINVLLLSMLFTKTPDELRLLLIDPKQLEFSAYADIPHLLHPVVKKADDAAIVLEWACREMDRRYKLLSEWNARNIANFNKKLDRELKSWTREKAWKYAPEGWQHDDPPPPPEPMPYIVIIIDELADLMMVAKKEVETSIVRLAQLARACGMHLVVATQRPSVDVVTGLIKSNMPTRIAFQLRSVTDSRTVLDAGGAEKLLGKGDSLMLPNDGGDLRRIHGPFVEDDEVLRVVEFLKEQRSPDYVEEIGRAAAAGGLEAGAGEDDLDELYEEAVQLVLDQGKASTSMIQRHLKIGYNRAARIVDQMERQGVVGPADGARPREILL